MKIYTAEELVEAIRHISEQGWHRSVKDTINTRNDGAVGNTLEYLLDVPENNLPIANIREWELKGQRAHTGSLITLKHIEPSPQGVRVVSNFLLPYYGWVHKDAGRKYPASEKSFRSTTGSKSFTKRGFKLVIDKNQKKVRFTFDPREADTNDTDIEQWLESVRNRVGLGPLEPEPYWGFEDLRYTVGSKMKNCFYVVAESKVIDSHEYFNYIGLNVLSGFSFEGFLKCMENDIILVDFDARTGHNHGTKFRIKRGFWPDLYGNCKEIF